MTADGNEGGGNFPAISVGSIRLTPNPADETVIISWQYDAKQLIIRDLLGRKVREYFMDPSTYSIGVSVIGWLEGLYMVELRLLNGHTVYERLLVMP